MATGPAEAIALRLLLGRALLPQTAMSTWGSPSAVVLEVGRDSALPFFLSSASAAPVPRPHQAVISKLSLFGSGGQSLTAAVLVFGIQPGHPRAGTAS
jgi:hypothetical protein